MVFFLIEVLLNTAMSVEKCLINTYHFKSFTFRNIWKMFDNMLEIRLCMYIVIFATKLM